MKKSIIFWAVTVLLMSSCSPKLFPEQRDTVTTIRIVDRIVYRDSLVEVPVPQGETSGSGHVRDTTDIIETDLAVSGVEIKDGKFRHWLRNKSEALIPHHIKLPQREVTTEMRNKVVLRDVRYVEKQLSGWQKAMMAGGYVLMGTVILLVVLGMLKLRRVI